MEKVFIDMKDAERAILNYIGSENFEKAMSALDMSNGRNSFIVCFPTTSITYFYIHITSPFLGQYIVGNRP